jgi:glycine dehydrogenase subunit 2
LVVPGAIMIEPTETESRQTLDDFIGALERIVLEARQTPEIVKAAPHSTFVGRLDETRAARRPVLRWKKASAEPTPAAPGDQVATERRSD